MSIRLRRPFEGDSEAALAWAREELLRLKFDVEDQGGLRAWNKRLPRKQESPLRLASQLDIGVEGGEIVLEADLGAARKTLWFLGLFLVGMGLFFAIFMWKLFHDTAMLYVHAAVFGPWLFVLPLLPFVFRARATGACRLFLEGMAQAAGDPAASPGKPALTGAGKLQLAAGILCLVYGIAAIIMMMVGLISGMTRDAQRVVVPGESTITFTEPGNYTIFHEYRSQVDGVVYNTNGTLAGLRVELTTSDGTPVSVEAIPGRSRYSFDERAGYSAYRFTIDTPGTYRIQAAYPESSDGLATVLSIVPWSMEPRLLMGRLAIPVVIIVLGTMLLTHALSRRQWNEAVIVG